MGDYSVTTAIQRQPMGDYYMAMYLQMGDVRLPAYKAMNLLDYEVGNIGNHEFNYGLDFLNKSNSGADFLIISTRTFIAPTIMVAGKKLKR